LGERNSVKNIKCTGDTASDGSVDPCMVFGKSNTPKLYPPLWRKLEEEGLNGVFWQLLLFQQPRLTTDC
jgi:hypothetical protein